MNRLISIRELGFVSCADEIVAMGRKMTNRERNTKAYQSFRGPSDLSDFAWHPALKNLGENIRAEIHGH